MASAQSARAAPRRQTRKPPAKGRAAPLPILRVRWDRVGRVSLLVVLVVVMALYINQAVTYFSVRGQAEQQMATALTLAHQNRILAQQQRSLRQRGTIEQDARALGMVRQGERPYVVTRSH
jgi:cell division protein FtsB